MSGCVTDSAWIGLSYVGTPNSLVATPILSAAPGNGMELLTDGIWVPGWEDLVGGGFPSSPHDGMVVKAAITSNISWTFRYNPRSTASNKWEFIGGADLYADVESLGTIASSVATGNFGAWLDLAGTDVRGPDFVPPFNGTYNISFGADMNPVNGESCQVGLSIAGADPNDDDTATCGSGKFSSVTRRQQKALNGGDLIRLYYRGGGTGTNSFTRRWISVTPVRVGGTRAPSTYSGT